MGRRQDDLGIKADLCLHRRGQMPQHGTRRFDGLEDAARQAEPLQQRIVPVFAVCADQCRCTGVGILIGGHAAEQVVEVVRHHQEGPGGCQLLGVFLLEGHKLVDRIERLVLDAGAGIMLGKGQAVLLFKRLADALGALIAVGHGIADALPRLVQQNEIHRPGVNADGCGGKPGVVGSAQAVDDLSGQCVDVPAEVTVLALDAVLKAVDLLQDDPAVLHSADNVPPAGCADIDRQCTSLHSVLLLCKMTVLFTQCICIIRRRLQLFHPQNNLILCENSILFLPCRPLLPQRQGTGG